MTRSLIRHRTMNRPPIGRFEPFFGRTMLDDLVAPALARFVGNEGPEAAAMTWWPAADFTFTDDEYTLTVDLPGMTREDVELVIEDHTLALSGERQFGHEDAQVDRAERLHGRFSRRFSLPADADTSTIKAEFNHGVLTIAIPKAEEARARKVEIA